MRGFAQHLCISINFSDLRELVNLQCATIGVGDCEVNRLGTRLVWFTNVHLKAPLLMHYCAAFIGYCSAVCGVALSPPENERGTPV